MSKNAKTAARIEPTQENTMDTQTQAPIETALSIADTLKAMEASSEQPTQTDEPTSETQESDSPATSEAPAQPSAWGSFSVDYDADEPTGHGGKSKYDWASFPAPIEGKKMPSVFIPGVGGKTIYQSIKKFRDAEQKAGRTAPEFTCKVSSEPKGVRVFRKS